MHDAGGLQRDAAELSRQSGPARVSLSPRHSGRRHLVVTLAVALAVTLVVTLEMPSRGDWAWPGRGSGILLRLSVLVAFGGYAT